MNDLLVYHQPREASIRALFDTTGLCLEIAPSFNPILPKRDGYRVESVDYLTGEQLRAKYTGHKFADASKVEDVDYVWRGEPLSQLVGTSRYDLVIASHVIEHMPDMLGFLRECAAVLKPDGRLVLAVPDRRRCFDYFRPVSSTGSVLQAHLEKRTRHLPASVFDQAAYSVWLDGLPGWGEAVRGSFEFVNSLEKAKAKFDEFASSAEYRDCHAWVFTPSSFRLIISDLNALGELALKETQFWETTIFECVMILTHSASGCPLSRRELLMACQREAESNPFVAEGLPATES